MTRAKLSRTMQAGLLAAGLIASPSAHAASAAVGTLTCHEASGWGFIVESTRDLRCVYSPSGGGENEHYTGHISKFGVDIGYSGASVIVWTVVAPEPKATAGALAGEYAGATGGASVGVGLGANVLVGGSNKSIDLQPVSFQGNTGLNVAAGIGALHLEFQPST